MNITVTQIGTALLARPETERIDAAVVIQFKDMMRVLTEDAPETVVLDLSRVNFMDSSGLGAVVAVCKYLGPDRKMILTGLTPAVMKVFRLTRMDSVFEIYETAEQAVV